MSKATTDMRHRIDEINTESLVFKAIRKTAPGNKQGNISKCWKLDEVTRHQAAMMHIAEYKSAQVIFDELRDRFDEADVKKRSLDTWLRSIRKAFGEEHAKFLAEVDANESIAFQSGDLVAVLSIVMASVAPKFVAFGKSLDIESLENKDGHLMMRFMNTMIDAAKVQAEARRTEVQTQNLELKLREAMVVAGDESRKPIDREQAQQRVVQLVKEAMGLGGAA
ncbi:MAG: hypothetical protein CMJ25_27680 [Phycisphaerae bacterium]|nr:hypothetical protein [Phycisphaerae bacterium]